MIQGTKCPDCGSTKLNDHRAGIDCDECGFSAPGIACARCNRQSVKPDHVTPDGRTCFYATAAVPKSDPAVKKSLRARSLVPPRLQPCRYVLTWDDLKLEENGTAVRITHLPTKIIVAADHSTDSNINQRHALSLLEARLAGAVIYADGGAGAVFQGWTVLRG